VLMLMVLTTASAHLSTLTKTVPLWLHSVQPPTPLNSVLTEDFVSKMKTEELPLMLMETGTAFTTSPGAIVLELQLLPTLETTEDHTVTSQLLAISFHVSMEEFVLMETEMLSLVIAQPHSHQTLLILM